MSQIMISSPMRFTLILLFIFSTQVLARDYELIGFEASDYIDWTRAEMESRLGAEAGHLSSYQCLNREDEDAFWEPPHLSLEDNNLRVRAQDGVEYTYQKGVLTGLDGRVLRQSRDLFINHAIKNLAVLETLPSAQRLLRLLEKSPQRVVIRLGNFSFNPTVPGGRTWSGIKNSQAINFLRTLRMSDGGVVFNKVGSGGEVLWHPTKEILSIESDGKKRPTDPAVSLAHELYHAWDSVRGLLDMRFVKGDEYSFETVVEYRGVWFENQIRTEMGLLYRKYYSDPDSFNNADLLDDQGEPIYIPHGCLL